MGVKKEYKKFKEYYQDPEFRAHHLAYLTEKLECPICHVKYSRCNKCAHERSQKHILRQEKSILEEQIKTFSK